MKVSGYTSIMMGLFVFFVLACSNEDNVPEENSTDTTLETEEDSGLTEAMEIGLNNDINDFAFNAFRTMVTGQQGTSLIFSPVSAASVLAMLNDGAAGKTRQELMSVLGFNGATTKALNEYFLKLLVTAPDNDATTTLRLANAIFVDKNSTFMPSFASDMTAYYHAEATSLDFAQPTTLNYINDWCARQTEGLIPRFLEELSPELRSLLLNAIYFSGKWQTPFVSEMTSLRPFYCEDGTQKEVQLMGMDIGQGQRNDYCETESYQALRMAYGGGNYAMTFILPKKDVCTTSEVLGSLTAQTWQTLCGQLRRPSGLLNIQLPRFTVKTNDEAKDLSNILKAMGATSLFGDDADFPNILDGENLNVSKIIQESVVRVTEEGTVAAAVTGAFLDGDDGDTPEYIYFCANHPFVFFISDNRTNVIYFMGVYHGE